MESFDVIVIGAGPGGYVAAIRAAQRGMKVACIEKEKTLGGTCLNVGCIPSKSLLYSTELYHKLQTEGKKHGIEASELKVNLTQMMERKKGVVSALVGGIDFLFKKNKITRIEGEAKLTSATTLQVGERSFKANFIILATGSEPMALPFLPFDEKRILSSTGALSLEKVPKKLLMIGAGVIGLELGSVYRRLGAEVEVVELLDRTTPGLDREMSKNIETLLKKQGFQFHLRTKVVAGKADSSGVSLTLDSGAVLNGDAVLVAIGRKPYTTNLGLQDVGIQTEKNGQVRVDSSFRTNIPNIFAIGDLIDGPMLAHKASEEGVAVVDLIAGDRVTLNYLAIPNVMYTWPEVACVGMTEEEARQAGLELKIGRIPFRAIPRARCTGDEEGFVKILGEKESGRILGLHMIGPNVSEMIHEGVIAIEEKMTLHELAHCSHAHPTCSEAIKEAALAAETQAIHV